MLSIFVIFTENIYFVIWQQSWHTENVMWCVLWLWMFWKTGKNDKWANFCWVLFFETETEGLPPLWNTANTVQKFQHKFVKIQPITAVIIECCILNLVSVAGFHSVFWHCWLAVKKVTDPWKPLLLISKCSLPVLNEWEQKSRVTSWSRFFRKKSH